MRIDITMGTRTGLNFDRPSPWSSVEHASCLTSEILLAILNMSEQFTWYYHRKNCTSCTRAAEFFERHAIETPEKVIASKILFDGEQARELAQGAAEIWSMRGKKKLELRVDESDSESLDQALLGPSGKLRAPAIRVGDRLVIGFDEAMYRELFAIE